MIIMANIMMMMKKKIRKFARTLILCTYTLIKRQMKMERKKKNEKTVMFFLACLNCNDHFHYLQNSSCMDYLKRIEFVDRLLQKLKQK